MSLVEERSGASQTREDLTGSVFRVPRCLQLHALKALDGLPYRLQFLLGAFLLLVDGLERFT